VGNEPLVSPLADGAGVEDQDVSVDGVGGLSQAQRLEQPLHPLRIVDVHLAAERLDVVAPVHSRSIDTGAAPPDGDRPEEEAEEEAEGL
jgi:hypothetical protein